jgi:hypothetical protein
MTTDIVKYFLTEKGEHTGSPLQNKRSVVGHLCVTLDLVI